MSIQLTAAGRELESNAMEVSRDIIGALGLTIAEFDHLKGELRTLTERVSSDGNSSPN